MKKISIIILLGLCATSYSQTKLIHSIPYIEVTGEGQIEVIPDEIHLSIFLRERNQKKMPLEKLEQQMIDSLASIGISSNQIAIQNMGGRLGYTFFESTLKTSKNYLLVLSTPQQVAQVFKKLGSMGVYDIDLTKVDHSEMEDLKMKVKVDAVKSAKAKATNMMDELGQEVGGTLFIQEKMNLEPEMYGYENYALSGYAQSNRYGTAKRALAYSEPELNFEKIQLEYQVLVRFEIE